MTGEYYRLRLVKKEKQVKIVMQKEWRKIVIAGIPKYPQYRHALENIIINLRNVENGELPSPSAVRLMGKFSIRTHVNKILLWRIFQLSCIKNYCSEVKRARIPIQDSWIRRYRELCIFLIGLRIRFSAGEYNGDNDL